MKITFMRHGLGKSKFVLIAMLAMGLTLDAAEAENTVRMLFIGNSLTFHDSNPSIGWTSAWGMAASSEANDYVHRTAAAYGAWSGRTPVIRVHQFATFETTYADINLADNADLAADVAFNPEIVVIALGENVSSINQWKYHQRMIELLGYFTPTVPATNIVVRSSFWKKDSLAVAQRAAADFVGAWYVDAGALECDEYKALGLFENAGVAQHPNDAGMQAIADLILRPLTNGTSHAAATLSDTDVVTEVGNYATVDGVGTEVEKAPAVGGVTYRLSNSEYVHVFDGSGAFSVPSGGEPIVMDYLVVGGGGGGGSFGGGGGAGGVVTGRVTLAAGTQLQVTVGGGGSGASSGSGLRGAWGGDSFIARADLSMEVARAFGGGGGAGWSSDGAPFDRYAGMGGSGGGAIYGGAQSHPGNGVKTQGHAGGISVTVAPGGGGGAGSRGGDDDGTSKAGDGGNGVICRITGDAKVYGTGGGGGASDAALLGRAAFAAGSGGSSGVNGGNGGSTGSGAAGTAGTGAGGGGGAFAGKKCQGGGNGGRGIVVFRYATTREPMSSPIPGASKGEIYPVSDTAAGQCDPRGANQSVTGVVAVARGAGGAWQRLACGDYVHTFTRSSEFVAPAGVGGADVTIHYLVVGGGGAGGWFLGGGGGGGGVLSGALTAKPGEKFKIVVGEGGDNWSRGAGSAVGNCHRGGVGGDSWLMNENYGIQAHGGGGGAAWGGSGVAVDKFGGDGGSGGGSTGANADGGVPGAGLDGGCFGGGKGVDNRPGGGGGACGKGANGSSTGAGNGGPGYLSALSGTLQAYGAGGGAGGGGWSATYGRGGSQEYAGRGGNGRDNSSDDETNLHGADGYGSGGGGSDWKGNSLFRCGGMGGRGVVIVRYACSEAVGTMSGTDDSVVRYGTFNANEGVGDVIEDEKARCGGGSSIHRLPSKDYVHVFTASGNFTNRTGRAVALQYLLVGGGGAGGVLNGGGGGGGGVVYGTVIVPPRAGFSVKVGAGGKGGGFKGNGDNYLPGKNGEATSFVLQGVEYKALGGGGGASNESVPAGGGTGGGGLNGRSGRTSIIAVPGAMPVVSGQGFGGGNAYVYTNLGGGAGGGGAGEPGWDYTSETSSIYGVSVGGDGGAGAMCAITGVDVCYGGGGGGGGSRCGTASGFVYQHLCSMGGIGGAGGGGTSKSKWDAGEWYRMGTTHNGVDGLGGGGAGASFPVNSNLSGTGGSGVAIFRYAKIPCGLCILYR